MPQITGNGVFGVAVGAGEGQQVTVVSHHWKQGARIKADATQGYQALRALYDLSGAVLPADVVAASAPVDAVLHDEFMWDDTEASRLYREEQARYILRSAVVVYRRPDQTVTPPVRAFVKLVPCAGDPAIDTVSDDAVQPHVYLPVRRVMGEPDLRQRLKRQAFHELSAWRQRYRDISDFAAVFTEIDRLAAEYRQAV